MNLARSSLSCALLLWLGSLAPAAHADPIRYRDPVFTAVEVERGIAYGEATNNLGERVALLLDLYRPGGDTNSARPAIVFAHGGGFTGGTRDNPSIVALAEAYALRGYVTASISYRIRPPGTPGSPTPVDLIVGSLAGRLPDAMHDAQHDMQAAVRWMRAHAAEHGVDAELIVAGGISAGASMALETAYNPDDPGAGGNPGYPSTVVAALSISGATDPRRIETGAPPVMLFNGTHDTTAPYPTAVMACGTATALLNVCELKTYLGSGHNLDPHRDEIVALGADFLCRHALESCAQADPEG